VHNVNEKLAESGLNILASCSTKFISIGRKFHRIPQSCGRGDKGEVLVKGGKEGTTTAAMHFGHQKTKNLSRP